MACLDYSKFVGRLVEPLNEQFAGRVEKFFNKRDKRLSNDNRQSFTVKYYRGVVGEGCAKKVSEYTLAELLPLLIVSDPAENDLLEDNNEDGKKTMKGMMQVIALV